MFYRIIVSSILVLTASVAISAQKYAEKPYSSWSRENAMEMLSDSSWARTYHNISAAVSADQREAARAQADNRLSGQERGSSGRSGGTPPVFARLHSALPIRQALVRLNQLAAGYDKMDSGKKAEFDEKAKGLLECGICQTHYVVTLTTATDSRGQGVEEGMFQGLTTKDLKGNVWLETEKGVKRELVEFIPPKKSGDSAVLFFARKDSQGIELVSETSNTLSVVFDNNFLIPSNRFAPLLPRRFEFKVSKLMQGGKLAV
jgi:hypothetical protein